MFRKIIKKLNNFRFTAILVASISAVAALYALFSFFMFHFAGEVLAGETYNRAVGFYDHENGGILSFLVFVFFVGTMICGIIAAYSMIPYIKNKEKLLPKKSSLIVGFVGGVFELALLIMMILLLLEPEQPLSMVGIIVSLPFGILSTIGSLCYIIPFLKCSFYMPEIKRG